MGMTPCTPGLSSTAPGGRISPQAALSMVMLTTPLAARQSAPGGPLPACYGHQHGHDALHPGIESHGTGGP